VIENQIRREDLSYRVAKALEIKGATPTLVLDPTVLGVVIVEDLSSGNEQDFAVNRWARGRGSSPAAAQFGKLSFNNHADSGVLVKIYQIDIFHSGVQTGAPLPHPSGGGFGGSIGIALETSSTGGTQVNNTKGFTDARLFHGFGGGPGRLPSVDIRTDNSGGLGVHLMRPFVNAVTGFHVNMNGFVLKPGTRLHFEALEIDTEYNAHVEWTETNI